MEQRCPLGCGFGVVKLDVFWVRLVCCSLIFCLHAFLMCLQALSWERCLTRSITCCLGSQFRLKGKRCPWLSIHRGWSLSATNLQRSLWWGNLFFGVAQVASALGDAFGHCTVSSAMKSKNHWVFSLPVWMQWKNFVTLSLPTLILFLLGGKIHLNFRLTSYIFWTR